MPLSLFSGGQGRVPGSCRGKAHGEAARLHLPPAQAGVVPDLPGQRGGGRAPGRLWDVRGEAHNGEKLRKGISFEPPHKFAPRSLLSFDGKSTRRVEWVEAPFRFSHFRLSAPQPISLTSQHIFAPLMKGPFYYVYLLLKILELQNCVPSLVNLG